MLVIADSCFCHQRLSTVGILGLNFLPNSITDFIAFLIALSSRCILGFVSVRSNIPTVPFAIT